MRVPLSHEGLQTTAAYLSLDASPTTNVFATPTQTSSNRDTGFQARGCAISVASADLMVETVIGRSKADTHALFDAFRELARTGKCPHCDTALAEPMERLEPLAGVHEYPSRVKCATLAWHALVAAMDGGREASSE